MSGKDNLARADDVQGESSARPMHMLDIVLIVALVLLFVSCSSRFTPAETAPLQAGAGGPPGTPPAALQQGQSAPVAKPTNGLKQSNSEGSVTMDVKWAGVTGDRLVFEVSMDTHSVELDSIDLGKSSVLTDDQGREYRPASWQSAPGGHHRSGVLAFVTPDSVSQGKTGFLQLRIRDVAGVAERTLKWEL